MSTAQVMLLQQVSEPQDRGLDYYLRQALGPP